MEQKRAEKVRKSKVVPMTVQGRSFAGTKYTIEDIMLYILEEALKREAKKSM